MPEDQDTQSDPLKQVQRLMYDNRFSEALSVIETALKSDPDSSDALYTGAVCLRYLKDYTRAQAMLDKLKALSPEFGRAYQEEGHLLKAQGQDQAALVSFQQATFYNPALQASWHAQVELAQSLGQTGIVKTAKEQLDYLASLPKPLLSANLLLHEGKLLKAEQACRAFLKAAPHHVEGMRLLAEIGRRFGVLDDADFLLETALELEPDNTQLRLDYIQILRRRQKFQAALDQAQQLYDTDPSNPVFKSQLAIELMQTSEYEQALELFDDVLEVMPSDPATLTLKGHALKTYGRQDDAVQSYQAAYLARPPHGEAYYALANLKTYTFADDELNAMRQLEGQSGLTFHDRIHLCFALGKAYEDREDFEAAFQFYDRGNALKSQQTRYKADQMTSELDAQKTACTRDLFKQQGGKGCPDPDPIFIVGLPRAGSTLLEQILASHSQVDGTLELPNILSMAHQLRGRGRSSETSQYPDILAELSADQLVELGEKYIEDTRIHRDGAPFFTDKMPNNFRHIGLIKLILPNAKIIDARREPMACCFSGFKQLFAEGQEFTYGLDNIGRYYRDYVELMRHWHEVLPGDILSVQYEDVVEDLETQVRRILDYCGLDFEAGCVEFHKTERAVRTASSEQVRQPIYKSGVEQWKHFEPWLDPLKSALGSSLTSYREHGGA